MKHFLFALCILFTATSAAQDLSRVTIDFQALIPTRDNLKLSARVYQPTNVGSRMPVLFAMTPYGTDHLHSEAFWFAQHGFAVVLVDNRGRGNSEGAFVPFEYDGKDGYDICKWIAKKDWCNGNIGMFGSSYLGKTQWLTLREHPPALKTIIPVSSGAPGIDQPMVNNIFLSFDAQWLALTAGRTANMAAYNDQGYWKRVYETYFKHYVPFNELPDVAGIEATPLKRWLHHPGFDRYYSDILPNDMDYRHSHTSVLSITGYFDDNQRGSVYFHKSYKRFIDNETPMDMFLVMGPWDLDRTCEQQTKVHNLEFSDAAVVDLRQLQLEWFDWQLRGGTQPAFLRDSVMYYEMGKERWTAAPSIASLNDTTIAWFLHPSSSGDNSLYNAGLLSRRGGKLAKPTTIKYDPRDTSMTQYRLHDYAVDYSWRDENAALFPEKAVFQSRPLKRDLNLCGQVQLKAFISLNVPDTDFEAILYEIKPDGTCIYLTSDVMRARYRKSSRYPSKVVSKDPEEYLFSGFHYTCRTIPEGSRLRLVFGALNSPYYQKNYNTGLEVHLETDEVARTALIKLLHGSTHPSALILPIRK